MTVVVRLDSVGVKGVGLPACRTSPHRPHQAGGDLIVVVPKVPESLARLGQEPDVPLRPLGTILGFADCVTYVCNRCCLHQMQEIPLLTSGAGSHHVRGMGQTKGKESLNPSLVPWEQCSTRQKGIA